MKKSLGYSVFRGYGSRYFLFFNKDTKKSIVRVDVSDINRIRSQSYKIDIPNFEI